MGYDINLYKDNKDAHIRAGATTKDLPRGGQYAVYSKDHAIDDSDLYLYITFNYSWYYYQTFPDNLGIKRLNGKTTTEALPIIGEARSKIEKMIPIERKTGKVLSETWGGGKDYDDNNEDYWAVSAKNAVKALDSLIQLCELAPGYTIRIYA